MTLDSAQKARLEIDGRTGGIPIPHQGASEGFLYLDGQNQYLNPLNAQK